MLYIPHLVVVALYCPNSDFPIPSSFNHVSIFQPHLFNDASGDTTHSILDTHSRAGATIPMSSVGLVVNFDYILLRCTNNMPSVKHHAGDRIVVSKRIEDGSGP